MYEYFLFKMLLLIWKSFSSLWDHNPLYIKPGIIKVDGIDRMTYSELEREVGNNIASQGFVTVNEREALLQPHWETWTGNAQVCC